MRTILILLILTMSIELEATDNKEPIFIEFRDEIYSTGKLVETTEQDIKASEKILKILQRTNPRDKIDGVVTSVSSEGWFLLIRCLVKTRDSPVKRVLAELDVSSDRHIKSFNVAIEDTLLANSIRTYLFRKHVSIIEASSDRGLQRLWNWHLRYDRAGSFRWTFAPVSVKRLDR